MKSMRIPMNTLRLLAAFLIGSVASLLSAQTVGDAVAKIHRERIQASYLLAFGRLATDAEVKHWTGQNPKSVAELVTKHRDYLTRDTGTHQDTIRRSYLAALGVAPKPEEIRHWMSGNDTYTGLVKNHVNWLKANPAEYEKVIKRSYQTVLGRQPTPAEVSHWKGQGVFAHYVLAACHEDWKRRGGAGLAKPVFPASTSFAATVQVTPNIMNETRSAVSSLIGNDAGSIVGNAGGNLVAAGGGNLVAAGGGNMVAAGGMN